MDRNKKLRIVLLDDDDSIREVLSALLTHKGYEVFAFSKPTICPLLRLPECRCNRNQSCADAILTDLDMPEMDGIQFIKNLKKKNCKCRHVAIMSGCLSSGDEHKARQLGCQIFRKPFDSNKFFEWLEDIQKTVTPSRILCNWFQQLPQFTQSLQYQNSYGVMSTQPKLD